MPEQTLCPTCRHTIDCHEWWGDETLGYKCDNGGLHGLTRRDCACTLAPSDIARALLGAPTDDEVERGARAIWGLWSNSTPWYDLTDDDRESFYADARVALRAARGLS